jgi:hypothetical protein
MYIYIRVYIKLTIKYLVGTPRAVHVLGPDPIKVVGGLIRNLFYFYFLVFVFRTFLGVVVKNVIFRKTRGENHHAVGCLVVDVSCGWVCCVRRQSKWSVGVVRDLFLFCCWGASLMLLLACRIEKEVGKGGGGGACVCVGFGVTWEDVVLNRSDRSIDRPMGAFLPPFLPRLLVSVCLSVCLSFSRFDSIDMGAFLPPSLVGVCLSVCLFVCLSVCLSVWLAVCLSVCLSVCLCPSSSRVHFGSQLLVFFTCA